MSLLFSPMSVRDVRIKNRLWISPMCQYSAEDGVVNAWHMQWLGSLATGGHGLVFTEATAVSPVGRHSLNDAGIWQYLLKPWQPEQLLLTLQRAAEVWRLQQDNLRLALDLRIAGPTLKRQVERRRSQAHQQFGLDALIRAEDSPMQAVCELIRKVAPYDLSVLVTGESGTPDWDTKAIGATLDQLEKLLIIDHVALVERHHDVGNTHLTGKQHVLTGLGHRTIGRGHHQDRTINLGSTGDHVLDVVSVTRHVHVRVVTLLGLVLDVSDRDRDTTSLLFRGLVDLVERRVISQPTISQRLRNGSRQRGLAMVDVTHRSDVHMRLRALKLCLAHCCLPTGSW